MGSSRWRVSRLIPDGRLPMDMPERWEPLYEQIARRGRRAGLLLVAAEIGGIVFFGLVVRS